MRRMRVAIWVVVASLAVVVGVLFGPTFWDKRPLSLILLAGLAALFALEVWHNGRSNP